MAGMARLLPALALLVMLPLGRRRLDALEREAGGQRPRAEAIDGSPGQ